MQNGLSQRALNAAELAQSGQLDEAIAGFEELCAAQPGHADHWGNLALALSRMGRAAEALARLDEAHRHVAVTARLHLNRAIVLKQLTRFDEARAAARAALAQQPDLTDAYLIIANCFAETGLPSLAARELKRAVTINPGDAKAWNDLALHHQQCGELDAAVKAHRQAIAAAPDWAEASSNLISTLQYCPRQSAGSLLSEAAVWTTSHAPFAVPRPASDRPEGRPLRVGYLTADARAHPVGWLLRSILPHHDKRKLSPRLFLNQTRGDGITEEMAAAVDATYWIAGRSDDDVFKLMRDQALDVLVDLSGHTAGNRLRLVAQRPAPVLVSYLGWCGTTGLSCLDALLSDAATARQVDFTEPVITLPHGRFCYAPPDYAPEPPIRRLPDGDDIIRFACFNNIAKLNPPLIACWAEILRQVPNSVLRLKWRSFGDKAVCKSFIAAFARHGVAARRLELEGAGEHRALLERYADVDIALDSFPFSGGQTTLEAIWQNVPVITLSGERPVGRQGESILRQMGLERLIAETPDAYVAAAVRLAQDHDSRVSLSSQLRGLMRNSNLMRPAAHAAALEQCYEDLLRAVSDRKP